jgi:hypothetical protein
LADGIYVFTLNSRGNGNRVAGAFKVTSGAITGGEQDFNGPTSTGYSSISDQINGTGSSIATTANGNLEITLKTCNGTDCTSTDANIGVSGVETLHATLVSSSRALITEFDTFATASGSLDLQVSSVTAPAHGYAFFTSGFTLSFARLGIGGIINVDGTASGGTIPISGTGSVFDINDNYVVTQNQSFDPSSVTTPDAFGRVVFTLNPSAASGISPFSLVGYIVDPGHIYLVETTDTLAGITGGEALGQGNNTGTFNTASISGSSFVFEATGGNTVSHFQMAGVLTANSGGTVSGTLNCNDLSGTTCPQTPTTFTGGAYMVDATGRVTLTNLTSNAFTLQLYLSGSGTGTVVSMDFTSDMVAGLAYQQTAGASFSGTYGMNATGFDSSLSQNEFNDVGPVTAGTGSLTGTSTIDRNYGTPPTTPTPTPGISVSGTFTSSSGVLTGTITGLEVPPPNSTPGNFTYYIVDSTKVVAIQTDTAQWTLINFELKH